MHETLGDCEDWTSTITRLCVSIHHEEIEYAQRQLRYYYQSLLDAFRVRSELPNKWCGYVLEAISKKTFGPNAALGPRFKSSTYMRMPAGWNSAPPWFWTKILILRWLLIEIVTISARLLFKHGYTSPMLTIGRTIKFKKGIYDRHLRHHGFFNSLGCRGL